MTNRGIRFFARNTDAGAASAALSLGLHALLIAVAMIVTAQQVVSRSEIAEVFARFLAPPNKSGSTEALREQLKFVELSAPASLVPGRRLVPAHEVVPMPHRELSGFEVQTVVATAAVAGGQDAVFTLIEVDSAATRYAWSAAPAYPQAMLAAKKEGYVKAQWVVDEAGYADTTSLKLLDYTADDFALAVREALPFMRFSPAKMGANVVKQLVQQEFSFRIAVVNVPAGAAKKP